MRRLVQHIQNFATGKTVLIYFIPTMIVYGIMLLYTIPRVGQYAPKMKLFDLSPTGYSFLYANELLDALGAEGRNLYLYQQIPLDFIYPGLLAVSYCLLLSWLFAKSLNPDSKVFYLCFVPVAAGLFDYLENIGIIRMLLSYPDITESLVSMTSFLTVLKSTSTTVFFVLLLLGVVIFIKRKWEDEMQNKESTHG